MSSNKLAAIAGMTLSVDETYHHMTSTQPPLMISDLPLKPLGSSKTTHYSLFIDVVEKVVVPDFQSGSGLEDIAPLESPLGSPVHLPPHDAHIYSTPADPSGRCTLMRMLVFQTRTPVAAVKAHALGNLFFLPQKAGVAPRMVKAAVHYVGSHLDGEYLSNLVLTAGRTVTKEKSQDDLDAGFKYIRDFGPLSNSKNEFN
eukprot:6460739-Amphidinium_carterae.1